jgi:prepilin-type N-terminal cleavage/methylation domain-containing protein
MEDMYMNILKKRFARKGFTLIEILVVIAIIAVLSVTVFVSVNPSKRIKDAKDDRRLVDMNSILTGVHQYIVDNKGALPAGLTTGMVEKQLGTAVAGCTLATGGCAVVAAADCVDLSTPLVKYLKTIPLDPDGTASLSKYSIIVDVNNIVTVKACAAEGGTNLSVSR